MRYHYYRRPITLNGVIEDNSRTNRNEVLNTIYTKTSDLYDEYLKDYDIRDNVYVEIDLTTKRITRMSWNDHNNTRQILNWENNANPVFYNSAVSRGEDEIEVFFSEEENLGDEDPYLSDGNFFNITTLPNFTQEESASLHVKRIGSIGTNGIFTNLSEFFIKCYSESQDKEYWITSMDAVVRMTLAFGDFDSVQIRVNQNA